MADLHVKSDIVNITNWRYEKAPNFLAKEL